MAADKSATSTTRQACSEVPSDKHCTCELCDGQPTPHSPFLHLALTDELHEELLVSKQKGDIHMWPFLLHEQKTGASTDLLLLNPHYTPDWSMPGRDKEGREYSPLVGQCALRLSPGERKLTRDWEKLSASLSKMIREGLQRRLVGGMRTEIVRAQRHIWKLHIFAIVGSPDALFGKKVLTVRWVAIVSTLRLHLTFDELKSAPAKYPGSDVKYTFLWPDKHHRSPNSTGMTKPITIRFSPPPKRKRLLARMEARRSSNSMRATETVATRTPLASTSTANIKSSSSILRNGGRVIQSEDERNDLVDNGNDVDNEEDDAEDNEDDKMYGEKETSSSRDPTFSKALVQTSKAGPAIPMPSTSSAEPPITYRDKPKKVGSSGRPAMARRTRSATGPHPPPCDAGNAVGSITIPERFLRNIRPSYATAKTAEEEKASTGKAKNVQRPPVLRRTNSRMILSEDESDESDDESDESEDEIDEVEEEVNDEPSKRGGKSASDFSAGAIVARAKPKKEGSSWRPATARRTPSATGPNPPRHGMGNAVGSVTVPENLLPNRPSSVTAKDAEEGTTSMGKRLDKSTERVHTSTDSKVGLKRRAISPTDSLSDVMEKETFRSRSNGKKPRLSPVKVDVSTSKNAKKEEGAERRPRAAGSSTSRPPVRHFLFN